MNKIKVLIADSTASVRQFIKYSLEDHFRNIVTEMANSGKNIKQRLESTHYDLVLYENELPLLDGYTLLEWLRKHESLKSSSVILISSKTDEESFKKAIALGANAYLLKPFKVDSLISNVTAVINKLNRRKGERYKVDGEVLLRTKSREFRGILLDIAAEGLSGVIERQDPLPQILERVEADIVLKNKNRIDRIAGTIVRMEAIEDNPEVKHIKIAVKFIDNLIPEKKNELDAFLERFRIN